MRQRYSVKLNLDRYGQRVAATKRYTINSLSDTLIFILKRYGFLFKIFTNRFDYDYAVGQKIKVNDYFSFPYEIDMYQWTREGLWDRSTEEEKPEPKNKEYYLYRLSGVLVHNGSADSGHYYR
jgi:ubiquitin C-terminal hydrolase